MVMFNPENNEEIGVIKVISIGSLGAKVIKYLTKNINQKKDLILEYYKINKSAKVGETKLALTKFLADTDILFILSGVEDRSKYIKLIAEHAKNSNIALAHIIAIPAEIKTPVQSYVDCVFALTENEQAFNNMANILEFFINILGDKHIISFDLEDCCNALSHAGKAVIGNGSCASNNNVTNVKKATMQALNMAAKQADVLQAKTITVDITAPNNFTLTELATVGESIDTYLGTDIDKAISTRLIQGAVNIDIKLVATGIP